MTLVPPSREALETHEATTFKFELRLDGDFDFVVGQSGAQSVAPRLAALQADAKVGIEETAIAASARLGLIQGDIGVLEEVLRRMAIDG